MSHQWFSNKTFSHAWIFYSLLCFLRLISFQFRIILRYRKLIFLSKINSNFLSLPLSLPLSLDLWRKIHHGCGQRETTSLRAATVDFLRSIHASRANACRVWICMRTHTYTYTTYARENKCIYSRARGTWTLAST